MTSRLILTPKKPFHAPRNYPAYIQSLSPFIGRHYEGDTYHTGSQFMQLLVFMGCAPNLNTDSEKSPNWVRIEIPKPTPTPQLHFGKQTKTPSCPQCTAPLAHWQESDVITCQTCNRSSTPADLNWRRSACYTRAPIIISPLFDGEAVPSDALEKLLLKAGGAEYGYCYVQ